MDNTNLMDAATSLLKWGSIVLLVLFLIVCVIYSLYRRNLKYMLHALVGWMMIGLVYFVGNSLLDRVNNGFTPDSGNGGISIFFIMFAGYYLLWSGIYLSAKISDKRRKDGDRETKEEK